MPPCGMRISRSRVSHSSSPASFCPPQIASRLLPMPRTAAACPVRASAASLAAAPPLAASAQREKVGGGRDSAFHVRPGTSAVSGTATASMPSSAERPPKSTRFVWVRPSTLSVASSLPPPAPIAAELQRFQTISACGCVWQVAQLSTARCLATCFFGWISAWSFWMPP